MFRHMKDRLAAQVVGAKRDCSKLQARLHDARAANQELHRKEGEVESATCHGPARVLPKQRSTSKRRTPALKRDVLESRASLQHKIESNKFLEVQIADTRAGRAKAVVDPLLSSLGITDPSAAASEEEAESCSRGVSSTQGQHGRPLVRATCSLASTRQRVYWRARRPSSLDALRSLAYTSPRGSSQQRT